jgi:hypothetical protein
MRLRMVMNAALLTCCLQATSLARGPVSVYVIGNNKAANGARKFLQDWTRKGKGCFVAVQRRAEAETILDVEGPAYRPRSIWEAPAAAQLLSAATGDILWSGDTSWGPEMLVFRMQRAVCKTLDELPVTPREPARTSPPPEESKPPVSSVQSSTPTAPSAAPALPSLDTVLRLTIESTPAGAEILVNSTSLGPTPAVLRVSPGRIHITLRKAGFVTWTREIDAKAGELMTISADLNRVEETPNVIVVKPDTQR